MKDCKRCGDCCKAIDIDFKIPNLTILQFKDKIHYFELHENIECLNVDCVKRTFTLRIHTKCKALDENPHGLLTTCTLHGTKEKPVVCISGEPGKRGCLNKDV